MSTEQKNNKDTEEVDLIVFFNYIGGIFNRLFKSIGLILNHIFSAVIYLFKVLFQSWKIILPVMILAIILGYLADKNRTTIYQTSMLVEPYFDTKYQLVTNIEYFNALINNGNTEILQEIFDVDESIVKDIINFDIKPGPETENDRKIQYEDFLKRLDSTRAKEYSYEEFVENRSIYSGKLFNITASAKKNNIFSKLENGIISSFTNDFSRKARKRRDTLLTIQKRNLQVQLKQIDSLQNIYIEVLKDESKKIKSNVDLGGISFSTDKQVTKEYDLFLEEQRIRDQLKALEEQRIQENESFDVISSFQKVGNKVTPWYRGYLYIFPILAFVFICLFFFIKKFVEFTLKYEK
tara:strand:+ start:833 stop:1885 length:1053 start_codon:yes stop_codon:yes gene_type:complete